jgi:hypothetical protein
VSPAETIDLIAYLAHPTQVALPSVQEGNPIRESGKK